MTIPPDWQEFLRALLSENTRFLLIGAHALAYHVEARLTEDLDVFVEPSRDNAVRLRRALVKFGFGDVAPSETELAEPDRVFMLGRKPWRIDILTGIDGVTFEQAWQGREDCDFYGIGLSIIGRAELLENKRASGRKKDQVDIDLLEQGET
jgi:hypothetical protein